MMINSYKSNICQSFYAFLTAFPGLTALGRDCLLAAGYFVKEENLVDIPASESITAAENQIADIILNGTVSHYYQ